MGVLAEHRTGAQARIGTYDGACADFATLQMAEGPNLGGAVHGNARAEHHMGSDNRVGAEFRVVREKHRFGSGERGAGVHRGAAQAVLHHGFGIRQFGAGIDAAQFVLGGFHGLHGRTLPNRERHEIREVELAFGVVVADRL